MRRLRCCHQGGQCLCCTDGIENLSTRVFHHARGPVVACLCDHNSRTGCQAGAADGACEGGRYRRPACACRGGMCWTCILLLPWCRRSDSCPQVRLRMTYKACTRRFLDHSRHTESKWPRQPDECPMLQRARFSKPMRSWSLLRFSAVVMGAMAPMLQSLQRSPLSTW